MLYFDEAQLVKNSLTVDDTGAINLTRNLGGASKLVKKLTIANVFEQAGWYLLIWERPMQTAEAVLVIRALPALFGGGSILHRFACLTGGLVFCCCGEGGQPLRVLWLLLCVAAVC